MNKLTSVLFVNVKPGQEFASVRTKQAFGGIKLQPGSTFRRFGESQDFVEVAAVILFDHTGNVADDAGVTIAMCDTDQVVVGNRPFRESKSSIIGQELDRYLAGGR